MLARLRKKIEGWVGYVAKSLLQMDVSPTILTVLGFFLALSAAGFYVYSSIYWYNWIAAALLFSSGFCDVLDGAIARMGGKVTLFGNFLDSLVDRYSDVAVIFGITLHHSNSVLLGFSGYVWGMLAILGSVLVSYTRAKAENLGVRLETIGIAERSERIIILIVFSLLLYPEWGVVVIAVLANITVLQRAVYTYKKLR